jgi:hypothetical protein
MEKSDKDDLIPVWIFREMIPERTINEHIVRETGMIPEHYQNPVFFEAYIRPEVERTIEARVGRESARMVDSESQMSLIDLALLEVTRNFVTEKRNIAIREYINLNEAFIEENINKSREILYNGRYTSTIIAEATPAEIKRYANLSDVQIISFYDDSIQLESGTTNIALTQIGADRVNGTKSPRFNNGWGFQGTGIIIGVLEINSRFDPRSPHLSNLHNLQFVPNPDPTHTPPTPREWNHATFGI